MNLFLIFTLSLALIGCGRDEPFDKAHFEKYVDNPFNSDMQPLSAYHGQHKDSIIAAKKLAEDMGIRFPPIYVRTGEGKDIHNGKCFRDGLLGNRIVLFPDSWPKASEQARLSRFLLALLTHEFAHCSLGLGHANHGIMTSKGVDSRMASLIANLEEFNEEHGTNLNVDIAVNALLPDALREGISTTPAQASRLLAYLPLEMTNVYFTHHINFSLEGELGLNVAMVEGKFQGNFDLSLVENDNLTCAEVLGELRNDHSYEREIFASCRVEGLVSQSQILINELRSGLSIRRFRTYSSQ